MGLGEMGLGELGLGEMGQNRFHKLQYSPSLFIVTFIRVYK